MDKYFNTINYHGFKGETPIARNRNGVLDKTPDYIEWLSYFPFEELVDREAWEEVGVNFNEFIGIRIYYTATEGTKIVNMMQGMTQLLKEMYELPQGVIMKVENLLEKHCESEFDGSMRFSIYNVEGVGANE